MLFSRSPRSIIESLECRRMLASALPAVFVTNNVGDSVTSFTVNPNGTLTRVNVFPSGDGPQAISLSPDGNLLAVANGTASTTTEELRIFGVNNDATLTPLLTTLVPDSPLDVQWTSNTFLAVTHTSLGGTNEARMFRYDAGPNSITQVDVEPTGAFNSRLRASRGGTRLYANNTSSGRSIFAFSVSPGGALTQIDEEFLSPNFAVEMGVSPDGNFLYGAGGISGDGNRVLGFSLDGSGALTPLPAVSFTSPGESPKDIEFNAAGTVLVAGHGTDATFRSFTRDTSTGDLTATGFSFDVGQQGTLADMATMGDLMFVTDSSTSSDGITGIYSFRINPDGSFTQLGPILETLGARPEYIATWSPAAGSIKAPGPKLPTATERLVSVFSHGTKGGITADFADDADLI